jgi:hypothetical protein
MKYNKEYCTDCKKSLKMISGKDVRVHAWRLYCEECYHANVAEGKIIPPSHYKIPPSSNKKVAIYMRVGNEKQIIKGE